MAEAERIIGTPDIPKAAGAGEHSTEERSTEPVSAGKPSAEEKSAEEPPAEESASAAGASPAAPPRGKRRLTVLLAVAVFAYLLDLVSKMIVVAKLEHHAPVKVVGDLLQFEAIRNAGAAFGVGSAYTVIFTVVAASVIVVIVRLARKLYSLPWAVALGLLLGGALGNLTDRVFRSPSTFQGAVVDFIAPAHFAVFNLADSAICCGGVLIVLLSFKGLDPDGTVHKD
ncbi:signal peptidase II [Streptomyces sp. NBC_01766]|uniref:signal peptidase II n=1 Tax=Streptomyces sp. NBC_01766 TaxID=2975936 RepID=UPI002DDA9B92|nr:signal peptidase II [Streptomyces sp. NBC_01766]WSC23032.1 signal peptidase II [Streptomyces sp. NBC_01766]